MKLLILGAGNAQVDLIEYCREHGIESFGCSYTDTDKGIPLLDHFAQINIIDADAIEKYARENQVDFVYSVGSDIAMPTVMEVSDRLGLPHFVSFETANICNRKDRMRETLGHDFKGNAPYCVITDISEASDIDFFPAVMKPVDSQGQRGVIEVQNLDEVKAHFENSMSYSRSGKVIVEKYLNGGEISYNGFLQDGEMIFSLISDRDSFKEFPGGIIHKHLVPTGFSPAVQDKITDLAERVCGKLEINNGPVYFQIKVVDGEPYMIEVTPRLDGCHMWRLIKYYCGVDLLDLSIRLLTGEKLTRPEPHIIGGDHVLEFVCQPPETAMESEFPDVDAVFRRMYYQKGDTVRRLNGYMEKCGYLIY